jgi:cell wall-associated NlpC family hydrolase
MLVRSRGINMPRDADLQAAWSGVIAVDRKHLRAGDLLFFGSAPDHITHTGMFIGHGEFTMTPRTVILGFRSAGCGISHGRGCWWRHEGSNESPRMDQSCDRGRSGRRL